MLLPKIITALPFAFIDVIFCSIGGKGLSNVIVPLTPGAKVIVLPGPPTVLAELMTLLKEPGVVGSSVVFVTTKFVALDRGKVCKKEK
jgi:hypothetical protein